MRRLSIFILLYLLFIIQSGILPLSPDFTLLTLVIISLHEGKIVSTLFGFLIGLCLDLTMPETLGINMLTLSIIGYAVSTLRNLFYQNFWQPLFFTFLGIALKNLLIIITTGFKPGLSSLVVTIPFTLILSLLAEPALTRVFYSRTGR
ncbi:MAG: rod shape-determining protein MreD [bacterium]